MTCKTEFFLKAGVCTGCFANTATCDDETETKALTCNSGHYLVTTGLAGALSKKCVACPNG